MGYLFLVIALFFGSIKGYSGKKSSTAITSADESVVVSASRMLLCIVIGFFTLLFSGDIASIIPEGNTVFIAALSGVSNAVFVASWLAAIMSGAFMLVESFVLLGVSVPIVLCRIFYGEQISLQQIIGFLLLLVAVYVMCTYNASIKGKIKPLGFVMLLVCGLAFGIADFSQKFFVKSIAGGSVGAFNFYTYVFAAITLVIAYLLILLFKKRRGEPMRSPKNVIRPIWMHVIFMAACLFLNTYFKTLAAGYLDAALLYPLNQGVGVMLSLLLAHFFFGEKINRKCIIGMSLAFVAMLLINLDMSAIWGEILI
jgi:drug/metabolite transporter (DMT)-like permease